MPQIIGRFLGFVTYHYRPGYQYAPEVYSGKFWKKIDIASLPPFATLADNVIRSRKTLLRHDRLYTLYQAIKNVDHLIAAGSSIAEVGVYRGGSSYFMASVIAEVLGHKPVMHCFDTFEGHPDDIVPELDGWHEPGGLSGTTYEQVKTYLSEFERVTVHRGRFQDNCKKVANSRFCLAHIDVDIYTATSDSLMFFHKTLMPGGIIIVDDYGFTSCPGARKAVGEFLKTTPGYIMFEILTGQAILIRSQGMP